MNLSSHVSNALANIRTSKLRSFLTLLGVLVGTASVVALVSSGQLATQQALAQFKTLGTDLLSVSVQQQQGAQKKQGASIVKLTIGDVNKLTQSDPDIIEAAPYTMNYSQVSYAGKQLQGSIIGATENLSDVVKIDLSQGRFVSVLDKDEDFCVIGSSLAKSLRQQGVFAPVGKQLRVGNYYYTIIGVAKPWPENMFMYADINNSVIVPLENSLELSKYTTIQNIVFKLKAGADINKVKQSITDAMNELVPGQQLFYRSAKQLIEGMEKQRQTFTLMLGAIGGISLIVGGIGVMNIMLVSVIERRREIGVRMAVGAKRRDIQMMFLTEAVMLTMFGGFLGVIIGVLVSFGIAEFSHWGFRLFLLPPAIGFLVSAFVGIFFGFYPARQASRLDPIETLRSE